MIFKLDTLIFVRYKPDVNKLGGKNYKFVSSADNTELLLTSRWMYDFQRSWLIRHPFLSLLTEIQIVKNK